MQRIQCKRPKISDLNIKWRRIPIELQGFERKNSVGRTNVQMSKSTKRCSRGFNEVKATNEKDQGPAELKTKLLTNFNPIKCSSSRPLNPFIDYAIR